MATCDVFSYMTRTQQLGPRLALSSHVFIRHCHARATSFWLISANWQLIKKIAFLSWAIWAEFVRLFAKKKNKKHEKATQKETNSLSSCLLSSRLPYSLITIRCHFILTVSLTTWKSDESDSNFRLGVELWIEGTLGYSLFHSISSATLAGNLVGKLFCVCLWTMQSQVRLIQKETQHRRRSYACGDDCCYSVAVVGEYFPLSPFPLQKTQTRHTNQCVSQHRGSDLLKITLKLFFTFKEHPVFKVPQTIPASLSYRR